MWGFRVEPAVLEREATAQLERALELADVANRVRGLVGRTGEPVAPAFDTALDRFVDIWSWTVDRMVDTTDGIGHSIRTAAYRYTTMDIVFAGALDAIFLGTDHFFGDR